MAPVTAENLPYLDYAHAVASEGQSFLAAARRDLTAEVPSCPGWDTARLVGHLGRVHRMAAGHLQRAGTAAWDAGADDRPPRPPQGPVVLEWYAEGLETLLRLLRTVDPAAQAWNFLAAAPTAAFWGRRMAHETAIHRWDAELATGSPAPFAPSVSAPGTFDPVFAADGIDEVLGTFLPGAAGPLRPPAPDGSGPPLGTVHVHLTDVPGGEWLVTFTTDGIHTERRHAKADTAVRGPAAQVYLSSWGREPQPQILGDEALASAVVWNG